MNLIFSWLVHRIRRYVEDRSVPEASYVSQMRQLWKPVRPVRVGYLNLQQFRREPQ